MVNSFLSCFSNDIQVLKFGDYSNPVSSHSVYQPFKPDTADFVVDDINIRYDVIRTFMEHTEKVLRMLLQTGQKGPNEHIFSNNHISIAIKSPMFEWLPIMAGGWVDHDRFLYGTDIVSLYACRFKKSYHSALHEIWSAFNSKKFFKNNRNETKWHIQEKHSIALDPLYGFDNFCFYFTDLPPLYYSYRNSHGRTIGFTTRINIGESDAQSDVFYTIWRRYDSEEEKIVPLFPEKPYMIYNQDLITENTAEIFFADDECIADAFQRVQFATSCYTGYQSLPDASRHQLIAAQRPTRVHSACPGGLANLLDADFSSLSNKTIYVQLIDSITNFAFIDTLTMMNS